MAIRTSEARSALEREAWPELDPELVEQLVAAGERCEVEPGHVLFEVGQKSYDLVYVETGAVDIVDRARDHVVVQVEAPNFLGELGMLMGQGTFMAAEVAKPSRVVVVPLERVRHLVATVPEISDLLVTAFAARRRLLIEWQEGGLLLFGQQGEPDCLRLLEFVSRNRIPHRYVDRDDAEAVAEALENVAEDFALPENGTVVITGHAQMLENPTPKAVAEALGMDIGVAEEELYDLVVVGGGPAGLATAVYAASEGLCTLLVEDTAIGGQAGTSSRIENYLGFSTGISGTDLAYQGAIQAVKFGARLAVPRRAVGLRREDDSREDSHLVVRLDDGSEAPTRTVVLANGVQYRRLPLRRLEELEGSGVYYAATHLEARFCKDTDAVIIGGGNSAGQAAMFLSRQASCTHVVVRGEGLSETMSSYLSERIENDPGIRLWTQTEVSELHGTDSDRGASLEAVTLRHRETGEEERLETRALFVMIGAAPNTDWLADLVELDGKGFVIAGKGARSGDGSPYSTSCPGVYAVGDIRSSSVKRVASAVGEGSVVVSSVHRYIAEQEEAEKAEARRTEPEDRESEDRESEDRESENRESED